MKKEPEATQVNPFGHITDYLSVCHSGNDEFPLTVTDGTHYIDIDKLVIGHSSNTAKPFRLDYDQGHLLLTHKQLSTLFAEYLRYNTPEPCT